MKKLLGTTLLLSTLSLSAFAGNGTKIANPFSGEFKAGKVGTNLLLTLSGAPAKKAFQVLAGKGTSVRLNSNTVGILKTGSDVSCLSVSGVDAFECKLLLNSKGDAEKLESFKVEAAKTTVGYNTVSGLNDYANMELTEVSTHTIYDFLKNAKKTTKRTGSLLTTRVSGLSVSCMNTAEVAVSTTCRLSISANGNVEGNFAK
jgi:hypothetical protein